MDVLKDAVEAMSQRIRSPFFGSVLLSFFVINWKPIWFLIFDTATVEEKFYFFDGNTDNWSLYFYPLLFGAGLAFALPWVQFGGAFLASWPVSFLRRLQISEASALSIHQLRLDTAMETERAALEAAQERRLIDSAKRREEAEAVESETLVDELDILKANMAEKESTLTVIDSLTYIEKWVLRRLGEEDGRLTFDESFYEDAIEAEEYGHYSQNPSPRRMFVDVNAALNRLSNLGLVEPIEDETWGMTSMGFEQYDFLRD